MNPSDSGADRPEVASGFDSRDSEILVVDGPGDTRIMPPPPHVLAFLLAERERLARLQALMNKDQPKQPPNDGD